MLDGEKIKEDLRPVVTALIADVDLREFTQEANAIVDFTRALLLEVLLDRYVKRGGRLMPEAFEGDFPLSETRFVEGRDELGRCPQVWVGDRRVL